MAGQILKNSRWNKLHLLHAVDYLNSHRDEYPNCQDIHEYGCYKCESLQLIGNLLFMYDLGCGNIFGFDSFEGLPPEAEGVECFHYFKPGRFGDVRPDNTAKHKAILIKGWFKDLTFEHVFDYRMQPCKLVHIDCDLYISAKQSLDFVFSNELVKPNSVIAYDEFKSTNNLKDGGESLAHLQIQDEYKVEFEEIFRNEYLDKESGIILWQNTFIIKNIGEKGETKLL